MALQGVIKVTKDHTPWLRELTDKVNSLARGGGNNTKSVTLTANDTSTIIVDTRLSPTAVISLMPTTANAAAALTSTFVSTMTLGKAILTHSNNSQTDRTFTFAIMGA